MVYVPIIKWKKGERKALSMLSSGVKKQIVPFFDIPVSTKSLQDICNDIKEDWKNEKFFFYLEPEWYDEEADDYETAAYSFFKSFFNTLNNPQAIPVFDLTNIHAIRNWPNDYTQEYAIIIREKEMSLVSDELNTILEKKNKSVIYIIIDLKYVDEDSIYSKQAALKAVLLDLDNPDAFKSIIVASNSFPSDVAKTEIDQVALFRRYELIIDETSRKLSKKLNFNYVFSDYGPTDLADIPFVLGMSPNFKIKYTAMDQYCYLKGKSVKRGGLDIDNVRLSSKILVSSSFYQGPNFSWADGEIFKIASGNKNNPGNLTTWVSYNFNHHISYIVFQLIGK